MRSVPCDSQTVHWNYTGFDICSTQTCEQCPQSSRLWYTSIADNGDGFRLGEEHATGANLAALVPETLELEPPATLSASESPREGSWPGLEASVDSSSVGPER